MVWRRGCAKIVTPCCFSDPKLGWYPRGQHCSRSCTYSVAIFWKPWSVSTSISILIISQATNMSVGIPSFAQCLEVGQCWHCVGAGLCDECPLGFQATRSEGRATDKVSAKDEHGEIEPLRKTKHSVMKSYEIQVWWSKHWQSHLMSQCVSKTRMVMDMGWHGYGWCIDVMFYHGRKVKERYPDFLRWCCSHCRFSFGKLSSLPESGI